MKAIWPSAAMLFAMFSDAAAQPAHAPPTISVIQVPTSDPLRSITYGWDGANQVPRGIAVDALGEIFIANPGSGGGSGAGGAVTAASGSYVAGALADGAITTQGTKADSAWTGSGSATEIALLKAVWTELSGNVAVTAASLPLPSGASTAANQLLTQAPVAPGVGTATRSDLIGCLANTTLPAFTAGQQGALPCDLSGHLQVLVSNNSGTPISVYLTPETGVTTAITVSRSINSANSAMATSVKASAAPVYGYEVCNSNSTAVYFRLFNLAAAPTVGTSTGIQDVKYVAPTSCASFSTDIGLAFASGIAFDVTSGSMADNDTSTIATANTVNVSVFYK